MRLKNHFPTLFARKTPCTRPKIKNIVFQQDVLGQFDKKNNPTRLQTTSHPYFPLIILQRYEHYSIVLPILLLYDIICKTRTLCKCTYDIVTTSAQLKTKNYSIFVIDSDRYTHLVFAIEIENIVYNLESVTNVFNVFLLIKVVISVQY